MRKRTRVIILVWFYLLFYFSQYVFAQTPNTFELMTRADGGHTAAEFQRISNILRDYFPSMTAADIGTAITLAWDDSYFKGQISLYQYMLGFENFLRKNNKNQNFWDALELYSASITK